MGPVNNPKQRRQAVRRLVCALCGAGVPRGRQHHPRPGPAPHAAPVPRRRARQMTLEAAPASRALSRRHSHCASRSARRSPPNARRQETSRSPPRRCWRPPGPARLAHARSANTLYMELPAGRVIIELAPEFAPHHAANIVALHAGALLRWPRHHAGPGQLRGAVGGCGEQETPRAAPSVRSRPSSSARCAGCGLQAPVDPDTYAPQVGFSTVFPLAADPATGRAWAVHCYGMVGAGRDNDVDSGGGMELYVVIGQAPRHLDRNITLVGRVVQRHGVLSVMPRGTVRWASMSTPRNA